MGRIIIYLIAFFVALYAQSLMAGADTLAPYVLRDGLILSLIGAILFGAGSISRRRAITAGQSSDEPAVLSRFGEISWLLLLLVIGGFLRYAAATALPNQCIGYECSAMLALAAPASASTGGIPLLSALIRFMAGLVEQPIEAIRLAGVAAGTLTLLGFYLFIRQIVRAPAALVATALLAQSPWHIWSSSVADSRILLPLLIAVAGWLTLTGFRTGSLYWLGGAGVGLGLLWFDSGLMQMIPLFWSVALLLIGIYALWPLGWRRLLTGILLLAVPLIGTLGIGVTTGWLTNPASIIPLSGNQTASTVLLELASNVFYRGNFGPTGNLLNGSLPGMLLGALMVIGVGAVVRRWWMPSTLVLVSGALIAVAGLWIATASGLLDPILDPSASAMLLLLPFLVGLAAVALDDLIRAIQVAWRPLVLARQVAFGAIAIALVISAFAASSLLDELGSVSGNSDSPLDGLLTAYLSEALPATQGGQVTYFAPADYLAKPTTGLQIGPTFDAARASGQLRPFDPLQDLLFVTAPSGDLVYLLDGNNRNLIELLQQIFPGGTVEPQPMRNEENPTQLIAFRSTMDSILANQGLTGTYFEGNALASLARQPIFTKPHEPLAGGLSSLPVSGAFSVRREGTLLVPQAGDYNFWVNSHPEAQIALQLDNLFVLDTSRGIFQSDRVPLARGPYRIQLTYRSEPLQGDQQPADFTITWQPPEGGESAISQSLLQATLPPSAGLLGTYYGSRRFDEPALFMQKDLLVGMNANLPFPYSTLWRGKIAASRGGEYLLGLLTDGQAALRINGQLLVDSMQPNPTVEADSGGETAEESSDPRRYVEGLIYLPRGWHEVEVAYVPAEDSPSSGGNGLELFWQPPGSSPEALPMRYLLPVVGGLSLLEYPLPAAPPLASPLLGNDLFALSQLQQTATPRREVIAPSLPPFNAQLLWQTFDGCGSGISQVLDLHGVAIHPQTGAVYAADTGNRRVVTYNYDGTWRQVFSSDLFEEPFDVAMQNDPVAGTITPLMLDALSQQIYRLDPNGSGEDAVVQLAINTSFYRPRGFNTDSLGNIAVADTGGARVVLLTKDGQVMLESGGRETLFGLAQPVDAIPIAGRLWAITAEDGRLWQLTGDADTSGSIAAVQATNTLNGPHLAALENGALFVVDPVRRQVTFHTPSGQPLLIWSDPSLTEPVGIDVAIVNNQLHMAIADHATCTLSLWQLDRSLFGQ